MATIEQLIERIEERLALVSGLDVQIHVEDRLVEMLRHKYNVLFDDFWDVSNTYYRTETLDGSTGQISGDISSVILRYADIHSVFYDSDDDPLPQVSLGTNPSRIRTRCIVPSSDSTKVFKVLPVDTAGDVHIWYRTKLADSVWETPTYSTEVPMDDELLMLGVMYDFIVDDGSNIGAEEKYKNMFAGRLKQIRSQQFQHSLSKRPQEYQGVSNRWTDG